MSELSQVQKQELSQWVAQKVEAYHTDPDRSKNELAGALDGFWDKFKKDTEKLTPEQREERKKEVTAKLIPQLQKAVIESAEKGGDPKAIASSENGEKANGVVDSISSGIGFVSEMIGGFFGKALSFLASLPVFKEFLGGYLKDNATPEEKNATAAAGVAQMRPVIVDNATFSTKGNELVIMSAVESVLQNAKEAPAAPVAAKPAAEPAAPAPDAQSNAQSADKVRELANMFREKGGEIPVGGGTPYGLNGAPAVLRSADQSIS